MHRLLILALLAVAGCSDRTPSAPAAEQITVDPNDVARLKLRFGDRLAAELGAPARTARASVAVEKTALHRDLAHKSRVVATPPELPTRTRSLVRGGGR